MLAEIVDECVIIAGDNHRLGKGAFDVIEAVEHPHAAFFMQEAGRDAALAAPDLIAFTVE